METRVLGTVFQKGGSGKTSTVINLGASLAAKGRRVLLVDFDPQGAVIAGLGGDPEALELTVLEAMEAAEEGRPLPAGAILSCADDSRLQVLPSDVRLTRIEKGGHGIERVLSILTRELKRLARWDYILIDSPPNLGVGSLSVLLASDELLIPAQAQYYAMLQLRQLMETVRVVGRRYERSWSRILVVPTMVERGTRQATWALGFLQQTYPELLSRTSIPKNIAVANAQSEGRPVRYHAPGSPAALAYDALADEIESAAHGG